MAENENTSASVKTRSMWMKFAFATILIALLLVGLALYEALVRSDVNKERARAPIISNEATPESILNQDDVPTSLVPDSIRADRNAPAVELPEAFIDKPSAPASLQQENPSKAPKSGYNWQIDGFHQLENAVMLQRNLNQMGIPSRVVSRVEVGPFANKDAAEKARQEASKAFDLPKTYVRSPAAKKPEQKQKTASAAKSGTPKMDSSKTKTPESAAAKASEPAPTLEPTLPGAYPQTGVITNNAPATEFAPLPLTPELPKLPTLPSMPSNPAQP